MVALLAEQALDATVASSTVFFRDLILQLNLPDRVQRNRVGALTGNPDFDARNLIKWAADFGTNPNDNVPAIGSVALAMLPLSGIENATALATIIVTYRLVPQPRLDALRIRFQIPRSLADTDRAPPSAIGPGFDWVGPSEEIKLESWLFPVEPELLEVSVLQSAVNRARSVCRVEISSIGVGTGVLVADDLVLTNYHVLTK